MGADEPLRSLHEPYPEGDRHSHQHEPREHVLQETQPAGVADPREGELGLHGLAERLHDGRQQDQEPPEDARVHQAGEGSLEQLPLPEHLTGLAREPSAHVAAAIDRPPEADQARQESGPPGEEAGRDRDREDQYDGSSDHRPESTPSPGMPAVTSKLLILYAGSILQ